MKNRFVVGAILILASTGMHAEPVNQVNQRAQLAKQNRDGVTNVARTLTIVNWIGHINDAIAKAPAGAALGPDWNPNEPHWDKAVDELMTVMMKAFDDLQSAPEAFKRLAVPYQSNLTEEEAAQVLALAASERKDLDAYADTMSLAVNLLERHRDVKVGSQDYKDRLARLVKTAKLPEVTDIPKLKLAPKTMDDYKNARMASVDFLVTAVDGQMQLYWFDHSAGITAVITKAATAAAQAKSAAH